MYGREFHTRWIIPGWPGPSADDLDPPLALNTPGPSRDVGPSADGLGPPNTCYDCCRASAHAAAERSRHSYLRGLDHDSISSDRTTNWAVQMLQLARVARFRANDWSDTNASEVRFICLDLGRLTIAYDQPTFEQAPSKRYRHLLPKRRKCSAPTTDPDHPRMAQNRRQLSKCQN